MRERKRASGTERKSQRAARKPANIQWLPWRTGEWPGLIDVACLLFTCGGFLALFGSLGGHFTFSKLNAAVCIAGLADRLHAIFRAVHSFWRNDAGDDASWIAGDEFFRRAANGSANGATQRGLHAFCRHFFMGFLWSIWDEDEFTWHDRFSHTYLSSAETYAEVGSAHRGASTLEFRQI